VNTFIFYTIDGFTFDIDGNPTENCQILGWGSGEDPQDAFSNFLKENEYILDLKFEDIRCQELKRDKVYYLSING